MGEHVEQFSLPDVFKIDFDGIDAEHEAMVDILNDFAKDIEKSLVTDFEAALGKLIASMKGHFQNEEAYMKQYGYPGLDWHHEHHNECIEACEKLIRECRQAGQASIDVVRNCFHQVVFDVARADLKFREFLVDEGILAE